MPTTQIDRELFAYLSYLGDGDKVSGFINKGANPKAESSHALTLIADSSAKIDVKISTAKYLIENGADIKECPQALIASLNDSARASLSMFFIQQGADVHYFHNLAFGLAIMNDDIPSLTRLAQYAKEPVDVSHFMAMYLTEHDEPEQWESMMEEIEKHPNLNIKDDMLTGYASTPSGAWYLSHKLQSDLQPARRSQSVKL